VVLAADAPAPASARSLAEKHVRLGDLYFSEARYKEASENYLRALTYAPEDASIHFVLADTLFALGDYHYAAFLIGRALVHDPEFARVEADKRRYYLDRSLFEKQLATLRNYLADKPYDAAAHLVLGYNLKFSADPEGAKVEFRRVLEIDPHQEAAKLFLAALEAPKAESRPESAPTSR
jgi:tetratricopeptide (TPR) repeat protein